MTYIPHSESNNTSAEVALTDPVEFGHAVLQIGADREVGSYKAHIEPFIFNRMTFTRDGDPTVSAEKLDGYTQAIADFALNRLDLELLTYERFKTQEYNPILDELSSMMVSLDHNAGVYYSEDDVVTLFGVMAGRVFDTAVAQDTLQRASASGDVRGYDQSFIKATEATFSLDRSVTLPVVKDKENGWRVADEREFDNAQDFMPLEIIRQDNADKGGWNKYRFRQPTYSRQRDDLHDQPVAEGWFASEWSREPNFWSGKLREALVKGLHSSEQQLQETGVQITLITDGGILKGTSTANTDIDTTCLVVGDSKDEFEQAFQVVTPVFENELAGLPFGPKKGQSVWVSYIDRSSGVKFFRDEMTGEFNEVESNQLAEGRYVYKIKKNEQGIGVTKAGAFNVFKKPAAQNSEGEAFASVDLETGDIRGLTEDEIARYEAAQKEEQRLRWIALKTEEDFVW